MISDPDKHEYEYLSQCCGAPSMGDVEGMCSQCHEWAEFECSCKEAP